jgi:hypothetical protein
MACAWYKCEEEGKWASFREGNITYRCAKHLWAPGPPPTNDEEYAEYEKLKAKRDADIKEDNRVKGRSLLRTNPDFVDIVSILRVHKQGLLSSEDAMQNLQTMVESVLGESL